MTHVYHIENKGVAQFILSIQYLHSGTPKELVTIDELSLMTRNMSIDCIVTNILKMNWDTTELPQEHAWFVQELNYVHGDLDYVVVLTLSPEGFREVHGISQDTHVYGTSDLIALRVDDDLQLKYNFNIDDKYRIRGKLLGYPSCCIDAFIEETKCLETLSLRKPRKLDGDGYLPCLDCNAKYTEEELIETVNKHRHPSLKPFPHY